MEFLFPMENGKVGLAFRSFWKGEDLDKTSL